MLDENDLVNVLKEITNNVIKNIKPSDIVYGIVSKKEPLEIQIDQKITLTSLQLVLCRTVTEWDETININWNTNENTHSHPFSGDGTVQNSSHLHQLTGDYVIKHKTGLEIGEKVVMIKSFGGQQYLVIDRVV